MLLVVASEHFYFMQMQVFIHYGAHSNISLLAEYGFIIPGNPDDGIPLTLEQLLDATSLSTSSTTLRKLKEASLHLGIAISPKSGLIFNVQGTSLDFYHC